MEKFSVPTNLVNITNCIIFVLLVLFCSNSHAALSIKLKDGKDVKLYDSSHALVLGASNYKYWPKLPGVMTDLKEVKTALLKHGFNVEVSLDPTRTSFGETVREFIGKYGQSQNNRLLFYFAGHGHTITTQRGRELGYFVPVDSPMPKDVGAFKSKAISMLEMEIFAKEIEAKHALFMFDSCFSGSLFETTRAAPPIISSKLALPVRQFITAGSANQTVPDVSIFRAQFVNALNGSGDMNNDGYITGTELAQFLEEKVTNYSHRAQTPRYGKIRDPILDKGDIVFKRPGFVFEPKIKQAKTTDPNELAQQMALLTKIKAEKEQLAKLQLEEINRQNAALKNAKDRPIVIVARAEIDLNSALTSQQYTEKLTKLMNKQVKKYLSRTTEITNFNEVEKTKSFYFDGKEGIKSSKLCKSHYASYVIGGILEESNNTPGYLRNMEYFIYDCDKKKKYRHNFSPNLTEGEGYSRQTSFKKELGNFLSAFITQ